MSTKKAEYLKALNAYEKVFGDGFPTFMMADKPEQEMIDIINDCVAKKKDVYDLGYLSLDEDILY